MNPSDQNRTLTAEDIQRMADGYRASRILLTAVDLDLFTALAQAPQIPQTPNELAARLGTDPRGTDRLLRALTVLGLLEEDENRFSNSPATARYLVADSEDYMGFLGHQSNLARRWATLTEAVKAGGRVIEHTLRSPEETERFIAAMHSRAKHSADTLIALIDLDEVKRVLDLGGGSGVYSMAFCRAKKSLSAVVLDMPQVTPLTQRYILDEGFEGRIATRDGDYNSADFGTEEFDLVYCSAIIHINTPEENQSLIARAAQALRSGGRVVVQDFVMDDDRLTPAYGAIFAMNMLVNTQGGDTYTQAEIEGWMTQAGLTDCQRVQSGPVTSMVIGFKD